MTDHLALFGYILEQCADKESAAHELDVINVMRNADSLAHPYDIIQFIAEDNDVSTSKIDRKDAARFLRRNLLLQKVPNELISFQKSFGICS